MSSVVDHQGPPSILVVDDNPLITNILRSLLSAENYRVSTSANGVEAAELLARNSFDLIICDVMMPEMDGYQLHHRVRENPEHSHTPFIFLTALGEEHEVMKGQEAGADDYVLKPFDPRTLLAIIRGKVMRARRVREHAEERYESYRRRVVHTLSHEFRTPLVAISTGTELLLEQQHRLDEARTRHLLEAIQRGGQRLERLVSDFMLLQQIEAGIARKLYETRGYPRSIDDSVRQLIESRQRELHEQGFEVVFTANCPETRVFMYEPQIHDALQRIVENAIKFSGESRRIEIVSAPGDCEVAVEVRDRGIGIDVERVREAIDAFGQLDRERLEQQGGGLGLALAHRYLTLHGGRLEFANRSGGGTEVSLVLPLWRGVNPALDQR